MSCRHVMSFLQAFHSRPPTLILDNTEKAKQNSSFVVAQRQCRAHSEAFKMQKLIECYSRAKSAQSILCIRISARKAFSIAFEFIGPANFCLETSLNPPQKSKCSSKWHNIAYIKDFINSTHARKTSKGCFVCEIEPRKYVPVFHLFLAPSAYTPSRMKYDIMCA